MDATALHGRFKGQLVAATAVDGHNWMFPVAYGVLEGESEERWTWSLQNLRDLIGHPPGLAIHTDACKGLETAVEVVFPGVEHRECMRHLVQNFTKKFKLKFLLTTYGQLHTHAALGSIGFMWMCCINKNQIGRAHV